MIVVVTAPTSTTNMTGLRSIHLGSSLAKLARMAGTRIVRSVRLLRPLRRSRLWIVSCISLVEVSGSQLELLEQGAERERREEGERADDDDHADQQADEEWRVGPECPRSGGHDLLSGQRPGKGHDGEGEDEAA